MDINQFLCRMCRALDFDGNIVNAYLSYTVTCGDQPIYNSESYTYRYVRQQLANAQEMKDFIGLNETWTIKGVRFLVGCATQPSWNIRK